MNKQAFWISEVPANVKTGIRMGGICSLISGALTLLVAILQSPLLLLDVAICVGLGLGILLGKSRVCAIICMAYYAFSKLIQLTGNADILGTFANLNIASFGMIALFLFSYGYAIYGTFQYQRLYKDYIMRMQQAYQPPYMPMQ